ncbi:MAG: MFS transporter, partial [Candidatus Eremiobacteraeota bacterium]|nr:MFS transporter [Candidatus Eremiobacteraeota bacterium]
ALMLVGGALGDRFGRRLVFSIGIAVFSAASLACALAPGLSFLIAARSVQGIGAALATPGSLALISAAYSGEARGKAIGTWSGFSAMTAAIGPVLGGWLTQTFSWRAVFVINVPLGIVVLLAIGLCGFESRDEDAPRELDFVGSALATFGLAALVYGLIRMQATRGDLFGALCAVGGVVLLAAFVWFEFRGTRVPMIRPDLFRSRLFVGANLYTLLLYAALSGAMFFLPFDLINVQGYAPLAAGAALLPFIVVVFLASRWSGGLASRLGARTPMVVGALLAGCGFALFARPGIGGSYWSTFFPPALVLGIGGAWFIAPLTTTVMDAVPTHESGIASGINNAVSRTAGLIAIAGLGLALAATFHARIDREMTAQRLPATTVTIVDRERDKLLSGQSPALPISAGERERVTAVIHRAYVEGFREAMWISAALALGAAMVAFFSIAGRPKASA